MQLVVGAVVEHVVEVVAEPVVPDVGLIVPVISPPLGRMEPGPARVQRIVDEVLSIVLVRPAPSYTVIPFRCIF